MSAPAARPPDDAGCSILHVDMDAFYVGVELRSRPDLRGRPVIVGGHDTRGVVLSASYEARAYGVHSAMPMVRARRRCPQAVVLPPDADSYQEASSGVFEVFRSITPYVEPLSLDEAFLDVAGAGRRLGGPRQIAELIRAQIADEQGLACSVGVAPTKFVAKLASSQAKPDGVLVVPVDGVVAFLHPLPVGAMWGVGERTEEILVRFGLRTIGDLAHAGRATLARVLGRAAGGQLAELAWGRDPRPVAAAVDEHAAKSTGADETFGHDIDDPALIHRELLRLSERTGARLRAGAYQGRTITLKVRFADFTTITRSRTLSDPTDVGWEIYGVARALFDALGLERARIRLVGVRAEGLVPAGSVPRQLLLGERPFGWRDAELAADRAARRFGAGVVRPAALVRVAADAAATSEPPSTPRGTRARDGAWRTPSQPVSPDDRPDGG